MGDSGDTGCDDVCHVPDVGVNDGCGSTYDVVMRFVMFVMILMMLVSMMVVMVIMMIVMMEVMLM